VTDVAKARIRIGLLLVVTVLIQTTLGSDMRVLQVAPDLMVLVVICAGLTGGTEAGAWVGFWAGLLYDMFLTGTPVGLSALTYLLIGASVGALRSSVLQERRALLPLAAFAGTAVAVLLFVGAGDVLGQTQLLGGGRSWLIRVMIVEALWGAVLALPAGYVYAWVARGSAGAERVGAPITSRSPRPIIPAPK
jgi:rod shape-determining protein MreD